MPHAQRSIVAAVILTIAIFAFMYVANVPPRAEAQPAAPEAPFNPFKEGEKVGGTFLMNNSHWFSGKVLKLKGDWMLLDIKEGAFTPRGAYWFNLNAANVMWN